MVTKRATEGSASNVACLHVCAANEAVCCRCTTVAQSVVAVNKEGEMGRTCSMHGAVETCQS
jgi:hypothetical protein